MTYIIHARTTPIIQAMPGSYGGSCLVPWWVTKCSCGAAPQQRKLSYFNGFRHVDGKKWIECPACKKSTEKFPDDTQEQDTGWLHFESARCWNEMHGVGIDQEIFIGDVRWTVSELQRIVKTMPGGGHYMKSTGLYCADMTPEVAIRVLNQSSAGVAEELIRVRHRKLPPPMLIGDGRDC